MRKAVRTFLKYGVDTIKLNLSGDNFVPHADAKTTWMSDEEVAMAVRETKLRGKRNTVHARSQDSIQQALRHGCEVLYHVSYTDEQTLDMLEAQKHRIFVVPTFSVLVANTGEDKQLAEAITTTPMISSINGMSLRNPMWKLTV